MSDLSCQYLQVPKKRGPKPNESTHQSRKQRGSRSAHSEEPSNSNGPNMALPLSAETVSSLEAPHAISDEHLTSPWMGIAPSNVTSQTSTDINVSIQALHHDLVFALGFCMPNFTLEQIIKKCIDVHMQSLFPLCPLLHELSIRSNMKLETPLVTSLQTISDLTGGFRGSSASQEDLAKLRSYTLIVALCAGTAFLLTPESVPNPALVGNIFLHTSREMLKLYQDFDIERPDASSLVIRMFHASALHTDGKIRVAWQVLGEALRLAEQMRLYEERSFEGLDPVEARLRRTAFWQLFIMDKHSALLEDRPMTLHEFSLHGSMTTKLQDELEVQLLDPVTTIHSIEFEDRIFTGFYISQRLWATASRVVLDLQTLTRLCQCDENAVMLAEAQRMGLTGTYLRFLSVLDNLPLFLQSPETEMSTEATSTENPRRNFWVQRTNLLVTYHCLRMILLQRFIDLGLGCLLGLSDERVMLALRKTEIAHDLINVITGVPFDSLRANGEACVSVFDSPTFTISA
jgi:Fungal specific transcription factor domain